MITTLKICEGYRFEDDFMPIKSLFQVFLICDTFHDNHNFVMKRQLDYQSCIVTFSERKPKQFCINGTQVVWLKV